MDVQAATLRVVPGANGVVDAAAAATGLTTLVSSRNGKRSKKMRPSRVAGCSSVPISCPDRSSASSRRKSVDAHAKACSLQRHGLSAPGISSPHHAFPAHTVKPPGESFNVWDSSHGALYKRLPPVRASSSSAPSPPSRGSGFNSDLQHQHHHCHLAPDAGSAGEPSSPTAKPKLGLHPGLRQQTQQQLQPQHPPAASSLSSPPPDLHDCVPANIVGASVLPSLLEEIEDAGDDAVAGYSPVDLCESSDEDVRDDGSAAAAAAAAVEAAAAGMTSEAAARVQVDGDVLSKKEMRALPLPVGGHRHQHQLQDAANKLLQGRSFLDKCTLLEPPPRLEMYDGHVDVFSRMERLHVRSDGQVQLWRMRNDRETLITHGKVVLPPGECGRWKVEPLSMSAGAVQLLWPSASLRIVPAGQDLAKLPADWVSGNPGTDPSWSKDLDEGFLCEFSVRTRAAGQQQRHGGDRRQQPMTMAELQLDMASAGYWFGGGHFMRQHWPLNLGEFEVGPFFPFDNGPNGTNTLLAPQWMTSRGLLVLVNPDTPFFHVGLNAPLDDAADHGWVQRKWGTGVQNLTKEYLPSPARGTGDGKLRLQARDSYQSVEMLHPLRDWMPKLWQQEQQREKRLVMQFALCAHRNVREAAEAALRTLKRPQAPPPREMVDAPIWTTWARYHAKVTQAKVEQFANEIVSRGLPRSVMEIDDKWQVKYGDFEFDSVKFPNPKAMVEMLHALGFKVTLWIMPFAEEASEAYKEGAPKGYFINSDAPATRGLKPGFFRWWQPVPAAALDVTNPEAVDWFVGRLRKLQQECQIDGFKFDAGEPCFLPPQFRTHKDITTPTEYTRLYVQEVASKFEYAEVRTGHRTTDVSVLTRMGDRFSTWSGGNGLRSLIPTLLTSGLLGYPFCLPDMIGGNAYFGRKPDVELLVRWAQANALMPAMQFSIAPWDLSQEADKLCKAVLELRSKLVNQIFSLMEDACRALTPVCRPMWWLDPEDDETFVISDQFAIGNDLIVAPVVVKGQKKRDVYLPKGTWCELLNPSAVFEGPTWLREVDAPLSFIPIYRRISPPAESDEEEGQALASIEVFTPSSSPERGVAGEEGTAAPAS